MFNYYDREVMMSQDNLENSQNLSLEKSEVREISSKKNFVKERVSSEDFLGNKSLSSSPKKDFVSINVFKNVTKNFDSSMIKFATDLVNLRSNNNNIIREIENQSYSFLDNRRNTALFNDLMREHLQIQGLNSSYLNSKNEEFFNYMDMLIWKLNLIGTNCNFNTQSTVESFVSINNKLQDCVNNNFMYNDNNNCMNNLRYLYFGNSPTA